MHLFKGSAGASRAARASERIGSNDEGRLKKEKFESRLSKNLDHSTTTIQKLDNCRQIAKYSINQFLVLTVARAYPNKTGTIANISLPTDKVFIFADDCVAIFPCVFPDIGIGRSIHIQIEQMNHLITFSCHHSCKNRRQMCIQ